MEAPPVHLLNYRPVQPETHATEEEGGRSSARKIGSDASDHIATISNSTANMDVDVEAEKVSLRKRESKKGEPSTILDEESERKNKAAQDFNIYATKKSVSQGLLDIALLTANVTMLKHLLIIGRDNHSFYTPLIVMLWISLVLQVVLGLLLLLVGSTTKLKQRAQALNNIISVLIFTITVLNVAISIFNDETITLKYINCQKDLNEIRAHQNISS